MTIEKTSGKGLLPLAVLVVGVMGVSSGAVLARLADAPALVKCAYRLGLSTLILMPFSLLFYRKEYRRLTRRDVGLTLLSGFFLAIHFAAWFVSLDYTSVASSVMLVNTIPIWVALIGMALGQGRPTRRMTLCIFLSVLSACIVGYGDMSFSGDALFGDVMAVAGAVFAAVYILCGREVRKKLSAVPYVAFCYGAAASIVWAAVLALGYEYTGFSPTTWKAFFGMALLAQVVGHSSYNWALGYFSAGTVAIMLLGEPIGSAVLAYFLFDEVPTPLKLAGFALLMFSIAMAAREGDRSPG